MNHLGSARGSLHRCKPRERTAQQFSIVWLQPQLCKLRKISVIVPSFAILISAEVEGEDKWLQRPICFLEKRTDLLFGGIKDRTTGKYSPVGRELEAFVLGIWVKANDRQTPGCVVQGGDAVEKALWPSPDLTSAEYLSEGSLKLMVCSSQGGSVGHQDLFKENASYVSHYRSNCKQGPGALCSGRGMFTGAG